MIEKLKIGDSIREENKRPFSAAAMVEALDKINELVEAVSEIKKVVKSIGNTPRDMFEDEKKEMNTIIKSL